MIIIPFSRQSDWVWQTRASSDDTWSAVSAKAWTVARAPARGKRCSDPWKTTLTWPVSRQDVDREYRCYLHYPWQGMYYNSSVATFVLRGYIAYGVGVNGGSDGGGGRWEWQWWWFLLQLMFLWLLFMMVMVVVAAAPFMVVSVIVVVLVVLVEVIAAAVIGGGNGYRCNQYSSC